MFASHFQTDALFQDQNTVVATVLDGGGADGELRVAGVDEQLRQGDVARPAAGATDADGHDAGRDQRQTGADNNAQDVSGMGLLCPFCFNFS